jgi:GDPmannose 4,6-dehydratase
MSKRALVTGISGQDGHYLTQILLSEGYEVWGVVRSPKVALSENLRDYAEKIRLIDGNLNDFSSLRSVVMECQPDEVYNLAAQSVVPLSWTEPLKTVEATGVGPVRMLEAVRLHAPQAKIFQPCSSEMLGSAGSLENLMSAKYFPLSPYAASKLLSYHFTKLYRERYGLFAVAGVLFNHESPFRPPIFVSRKITIAAAKAKNGMLDQLPMGNIDITRDWGFAGDYMKAAHAMLQDATPRDYIVATGIPHTVRDMLETAFKYVGLNYEDFVTSDDTLLRPLDAEKIVGDPSDTKRILSWEPKVQFRELIHMMTDADLKRVKENTL